MEITFIESNLEIGKKKAWECEFAAQDDFNLHIERVEGGRFLVYQKSVEDGEYAIVDGIVRHDHKDVIDLDMTALVYPKWIKIVSESEVTSAYLTTDGEVTLEGGGLEPMDILYFYNGSYGQTNIRITDVETLDGTYDHGQFTVVKTEDGFKVGHPLSLSSTSKMKVFGYISEVSKGNKSLSFPEAMSDKNEEYELKYKDSVGTQVCYTLASGIKVILEKTE